MLGLIDLKPNLELESTLDSLQVVLDKLENLYADITIILGGDFNARLGDLDREISPGTFRDTIRLLSRNSQDTNQSTRPRRPELHV